MEKVCAESKFSEYQFLNLFLTILKKQTSFSIIDKKALEEVLFDYYKEPEFKLLFEDIERINQIDNKRINLENSFMTAITWGLLTQINDSATGRYINNIYGEKEIQEYISNYDEEKVSAIEKLVKEVYPKYIMRLDYQPIKITEETRQYVKDYPEKHLECPPRVFMGKFYTDKEWEKTTEKILSKELP